MNIRNKIFTLFGLLCLSCLLVLAVAATSPTEERVAQPSVPEMPEVLAQVSGFSVGNPQGLPVVVFFDPQCPHCGKLWHAVKPLYAQVRFTWVPTPILRQKSVGQSIAVLQADDPAQWMDANEASLSAGQGGLAGAEPAGDLATRLKSNVELFARFKPEGVPFFVATTARSGTTVTSLGLPADQMRRLLELN